MDQVAPTTALLRRGQVKDWLGLDDNEITKWIIDGIIKPRYFRKGARAYFVRKEIEEIIKPEVMA